ncbi:hypothetical protein [Ureaplasma ceti]|uniref:Replication initiation and membrane attachment family protein n=1 Tax=Ureaplasma ceti TaxID=3119530 RepID=A0ABP9U5E6_9BACT
MSNFFKKMDKFEIYLNYGSEFSDSALNELYMPIIGVKAVAIYRFMFEQVRLQKYTSLNLVSEEQLYNTLGISRDEFVQERHKLESIGLLKTFIKDDVASKTTVFFLNGTLSYREFIEKPELNNLLKKCLTDFGYKQLVYKFNNFVIKANYQDVSVGIDWLLENHEVTHLNALDFTALYNRLISATHLNVVISSESKAQLLSIYKNFNLTEDDIYAIVKASLVLADSKTHYEISYSVLQMNIERIKFMKSEEDIKILTKINRNFEIFSYDTNLDNFNYVLNDYRQITTENYILSITKEDLSLETTKVLNRIRNKFLLPDPIINVIVDFSLFKNSGRLVPKYIEKVAKTVNNLGINSVEAIIQYLQCVSNHRRPSTKLFKTMSKNHAKDDAKVLSENNDKIISITGEGSKADTYANLDDPWGKI